MCVLQVPYRSVMKLRSFSTALTFIAGYILLLIPYSVTRLLQISGFFVSFGFLVLAYTCWFMLGKFSPHPSTFVLTLT
jgi:hypothetical protein